MPRAVAIATKTIAERIAERSDDLAPAEQRVAEFLLDAGPQASLLSAAALAEQLGTSDATVVRTAKALGYSGLAELRRELAASSREPQIGERLQRTLAQASESDVFASSISNHLAALDTAVRRISSKQFGAAVNVLAASRRIVWRGVGPSAHLAANGQLLSQRVGKPSRALVETGTSFADELLALDRRDAVVVLAYGRLQSHVRVLLDRAEALDVPVVLITDSLARRLGPSVRVTLECGRGAPGLFASHGVTLVVIEALIIAVAARDQTASTESLRELNELRAALAGRRFDVDAS